MSHSVGGVSRWDNRDSSGVTTRAQSLSYFLLTVLGFSFWFFMAVPFASHRESYWWLGMVQTKPLAYSLGFISVTYRPLAQATTWLGFALLDPSIFPTSALRQALLQGFVYAMFVLAWGLLYVAARQRRLFALVAFAVGGTFFSGYVHLFHIYGMFYVPVILMLAAVLRFHSDGSLARREVWLAVGATLLALWHPFATALFLGFYFGFYLDTFGQRRKPEHRRALGILLAGAIAIGAVLASAPVTEAMTLDARVTGFLVSYQTNEVHWIASLLAFLLAQLTVFGMEVSWRQRVAGFLLLSALGAVFYLKGLPLLFLWLAAVWIKLFLMRSWSLFFGMLAATLLPLGKGSGTPIYGLFAIIVAAYGTCLGWVQAERAISFFKSRYAVAIGVALVLVVLLVRMGIDVPVVTTVARPLLVERERTYQLEHVLAWLHKSDYCAYEIDFAEQAGNPIESVESAMTRRNRPPAGLGDVQVYWTSVLQCQKAGRPSDKAGTAILTFGGPTMAHRKPVFEVKGRYAGAATVWVEDSQTR